MKPLSIALTIVYVLALVGTFFMAEAGPREKWIITGELQRHNPTQFRGETFWVNGWRLTIEDRPDAKVWLEQQVGKQVRIEVSAK